MHQARRRRTDVLPEPVGPVLGVAVFDARKFERVEARRTACAGPLVSPCSKPPQPGIKPRPAPGVGANGQHLLRLASVRPGAGFSVPGASTLPRWVSVNFGLFFGRVSTVLHPGLPSGADGASASAGLAGNSSPLAKAALTCVFFIRLCTSPQSGRPKASLRQNPAQSGNRGNHRRGLHPSPRPARSVAEVSLGAPGGRSRTALARGIARSPYPTTRPNTGSRSQSPRLRRQRPHLDDKGRLDPHEISHQRRACERALIGAHRSSDRMIDGSLARCDPPRPPRRSRAARRLESQPTTMPLRGRRADGGRMAPTTSSSCRTCLRLHPGRAPAAPARTGRRRASNTMPSSPSSRVAS